MSKKKDAEVIRKFDKYREIVNNAGKRTDTYIKDLFDCPQNSTWSTMTENPFVPDLYGFSHERNDVYSKDLV